MKPPMHATSILTMLALVTALGTCVRVLLQPQKTALHWNLLALLATTLVWIGGGLSYRFASTPAQLLAAAHASLFGTFFAPSLHLLLMARFARVQLVEDRPLVSLGMLAPALLFSVALLTNQHHGLVLRQAPTAAALVYGPVAWAGPMFWVAAMWGLGCGSFAIVLQLHAARHVVRRRERTRGLLLALTAGVPVAVAVLYLFRIVVTESNPIAPSVALSISVLALTVMRYRLLDSLPLARRDVIDQLRDGVLLCDVEGLILDGNAAATRLLSTPIGALRARPVGEVLAQLAHPDYRGAVDDAVSGLLTNDTPARLELRTPDERWIELQASSVSDRKRGRAGAFVLLRDRTDEMRYERTVRQSQKLETVGTLVAGVAHELNNPLAFLRANLGHLRRLADIVSERLDVFESKQADELREFSDIVDESIDGIERIAHVVDSMRRFSRIPRDEVLPIDVNLAVRDAIRLAELHANRAVSVDARLSPTLPKVSGSAERLVQVLLNLLVNAKQAAGGREGGRIGVETRAVQGGIEIRVSDNGPGISADIQHRIFDPFFTTKDPDEGTGLGLAIAFDIVREHGGRLEVESEEGEGATFRVHLPSVRGPA